MEFNLLLYYSLEKWLYDYVTVFFRIYLTDPFFGEYRGQVACHKSQFYLWYLLYICIKLKAF